MMDAPRRAACFWIAAFAGTVAQTNIITNGLLKNAHAIEASIGGRLSF